MVVVADTSPLNYLVLIEAVDILHVLYQSIRVSEAARYLEPDLKMH